MTHMHIMIQCGKCFLIKISEKEDITSLHMHADLVQSLSHVQLFATPWTAALQASLCFTTSQSLLKLMSIEKVMPSNHLVFCYPLLLLLAIFPSIRVFSNKLALCIMWPNYWGFSFSISPSNEYSGFISFRIDWFGLLAVKGSLKVFSSTTVGKHQSFGAQHYLWSTLISAHDYWKNHSFDYMDFCWQNDVSAF